jgi:hypothetical protein
LKLSCKSESIKERVRMTVLVEQPRKSETRRGELSRLVSVLLKESYNQADVGAHVAAGSHCVSRAHLQRASHGKTDSRRLSNIIWGSA